MFTSYFIAGIAAFLPIFVWMVIFFYLRPVNKKFLVGAFIAGCFSPLIVLLYQKFWGVSMNAVFFEITPLNFKESLSDLSPEYFLQNFLVFVFGVGMMEEYVKHLVVRKEKPAGIVLLFVAGLFFSVFYFLYLTFTQGFPETFFWYLMGLIATFYIFSLIHKYLQFKSIDEVILAGVMSALGFAFIENIIYVLRVLESVGGGVGTAIMVLIGRSIFVVMVHVLCSGIFAYHYGIALFAGPYLKKHEVEGKKFFLIEILRKILRFSKKTVFEEEKILEGLVLAMVFHGIYDFILGVNLQLTHVFQFFGLPFKLDIPLFSITMMAYLFVGFFYLKKLLEEKNNHVKFGLVGTEAMPEKDFGELLEKVHMLNQQKVVEEKAVAGNVGTSKEIHEVQSYINYLQKYKLLEQKYVGSKWIPKEDFQKLKDSVESIKTARAPKKSQNNS